MSTIDIAEYVDIESRLWQQLKGAKIERTPNSPGYRLTVTITAYDSGVVQVDGIPMYAEQEKDPTGDAAAWAGAVNTTTGRVAAFCRFVTRQRAKGAS